MSENTSEESIDLRIKRSRKHLIEALLMLMQDQPLQKISVRDITDEAMVNRSTFYAHFTDKYDLFKTAIGQRMRQDLVTGLGDSTGFTETNLRTLILISGNLMVKISQDCQPTSMSELIPLIMTEMQNSIHEVVLAWMNKLNISKAEASTLAMFIAGAVFGAVALWGQQSDSKQRSDEFANQIIPLLMVGVGQYGE
ncbi:MAG: TetR/AcrR family transcriptional regulator [Chloroflexota bacterium]